MNTTVLNYFPLRDPSRDARSFYAKFWQTNMIIHARTRQVRYSEHRAPLSIKCAFGGREVYETNVGRFSVDDHTYLVLNEAQTYSSYIESEAEVESLSLFFHTGFAEEVLSSLLAPADKLLDDPLKRRSQPLLFFERLYPHDRLVTPRLLSLRRAAAEGNASYGWLEEQFHLLLGGLLVSHRRASAEADKLEAVRASTRVEAYRRLMRARDFIDASFHEPLHLAGMAHVACLSTHHFLRLFKELFRETPHQYLTRRRLEAACRLLQETDQPVTQICLSVGFENASSFSRTFRHRYGLAPENFRRRHKKAIFA
jgi:AraC family transcriptional regulator